MNFNKNETYGKKFYHLGPERDNVLFIHLKKIKQQL